MITLTCTCIMCGGIHEIYVRPDDYYNWIDGQLAQEAFPYLSAEEREMLISGICPDCWNWMFKEEE